MTSGKEREIEGADRVHPVTRALATLIVPFLVAAFIILYLRPDEAGRLFAWPIQPRMTAMMLGATYLGGVWFFGRVSFERRWHRVQLGFLPVSAFAAILGAATLLHWDRFSHGRIGFQLWTILYLTLPFVLPVVWTWNRRVRLQPRAGELLLPGLPRGVIGALSAGLALVAVGLFVAPALWPSIWPWALSALTARVMAAMFALSGWVGVGVALDGRVSAARILMEAQAVAIVLILVAMLISRADFDWGRPGGWLFAAGMGLILGLDLSIVLRRFSDRST